ncbi:MAG: sulfatase-like hydrolase/transferase [Bryocella sp.]
MASGALMGGAASAETPVATRRPNILMICADQFRADFVGANHANPSVITPHLDALAARGTNFAETVSNQPLCSPSRASFMTGVTATKTGVWKLGLELDHSLPTVATECKKAGYTTAFIGKWHIAATGEGDGPDKGRGWVEPGPRRAGFDDLWEGANVLELVSHPYEGNYWDNSGKNIGYKDIYRVDFITDRGVQFIKQQHDKPWFLFLSQLEPHHQNDVDEFVPPKRYEQTYPNSFVPADLRRLPGNWPSHLPGYYGCVQAIDDCVGKLVDTLRETGQLENTVVVFFSDHGCTFRTRLGEYKRSPHESSLRVPLVVAGPGFDQAMVVKELVSLLDLTPTLLDAAGVMAPASMQGKSLKPLASSADARKAWDSTAYVQISSSICGRAIRTKDWTYCCYDPTQEHGNAEFGGEYSDFALYSLSADPEQLVNLVGRPEYKKVCNTLREELKKRIVANGEPPIDIKPIHLYA